MSENAQSKIGKLTSEREKRDAIHVAIIPVKASCDISAGTPVRFCKGSTTTVRRAHDGYSDAPSIGVIDPFLRGPGNDGDWGEVKEGEWCWLFLNPNTVTGLRHEWQHPAFPEPEPMKPGDADAAQVKRVLSAIHGDSEEWLRDYAAMLDCTYEELIETAKNVVSGNDDHNAYITTMGFDTPDRASTEIMVFWEHFHNVTGITVPHGVRQKTFFSCSC